MNDILDIFELAATEGQIKMLKTRIAKYRVLLKKDRLSESKQDKLRSWIAADAEKLLNAESQLKQLKKKKKRDAHETKSKEDVCKL